MPETYYVCNSCDRIFDENDKPVELTEDQLNDLIEFDSTECRECLDYAQWENEEYFKK